MTRVDVVSVLSISFVSMTRWAAIVGKEGNNAERGPARHVVKGMKGRIVGYVPGGPGHEVNEGKVGGTVKLA